MRAEVTNSSSRITRTSPRTTRQNRTQPISATAMTTVRSPGPITAARTIARSIGGNDMKTSTTREIAISVQPPK